MLFDLYLFADYSGAYLRSAQRRSIRLAEATPSSPPRLLSKRLTRDELVIEFLDRLRDATRRGYRTCFGQDHQYGIPVALGRELGLDHLPWREVLDRLCEGAYGSGAPALGHPRTYCAAFNAWLAKQGQRPYFYSATKADPYALPSHNPRPGDRSTYRLTEGCRSEGKSGHPKPFNRVGDNGTVGGQSLVGLIALRSLLTQCAKDGVPVAVWPFDGLSLSGPAYENAHVLVEPYPTAVRQKHVRQSDDSDALASVDAVRKADAEGHLFRLLDLSSLEAQAGIVRFEGWILSHDPAAPRLT
jgi:hypothetical protein